MSRLRAIMLVARREIIERGRSRGFIFSVAFTTLIIVASFVVPMIIFGEEEGPEVGVLEAPAGLTAAIEDQGSAADVELVVVELADEATAAAALEAGEVDVVVEVPSDLSTAGRMRFWEEVDPLLGQVVAASVADLRTEALLAGSGLAPGSLQAAQQPPDVVIADPPDPDTESRFFMANIGAVLVLVGVFGFGFTVLTGVVEEKQSRVVEIVLATVRARDLLMGKVLGIGVLGLVQLAVFVIAALVAVIATQRFTLPTTTPSTIVLLTIWFILGYALYATILGALASLASRMEEASNVSTPVTIVAMMAYFVSVFAVAEDPDGPVAMIATFLPPSAPFAVPLRAAVDAIAPWEIAVAVLTTVAAIWVLFELGARIYTGAVLQTTGRMKIRDAWRAGR
jgi:ABC-2 type transport system permease protein